MLFTVTAPVRAEPITFQSHGANLQGALVSPPRPIAAVILLHGSGPDGGQDYRAQAEMFAAMNVAAFIYDKRGWQRSGGDWHERNVALLADDAIAAARLLRQALKIPVGYWGISQGGWVLARIAATDRDASFLIGVAAAGISPVQQELWHKQRMMETAQYPLWARRVADHFWSGALGLMVRLDRHPDFMPKLLEGERAASSFGLDYDPLHDWRMSKAPLLLLHGAKDLIAPSWDGGRRIRAVRPTGSITVVKVVPAASHAITTKTTGLAFDWGEAYDPVYATTMAAFIADPSKLASVSQQSPAATNTPWPARRPLAAYTTLGSLILLPIVLLAALLKTPGRLSKMQALTGLAGYSALVSLLAYAIYPHGSFYSASNLFPIWGWLVPLFAAATVSLCVVILVQAARRREASLALLSSGTTLAFAFLWF